MTTYSFDYDVKIPRIGKIEGTIETSGRLYITAYWEALHQLKTKYEKEIGVKINIKLDYSKLLT
jgi:hypothetical protein